MSSTTFENFKCLSISYKNTSVDLRGAIYLSESETHQFIVRLKDILDIKEVLFVSTCNRIEIYYSHEENLNSSIILLLKTFKNNNAISIKSLTKHFNTLNGFYACEHLYRVALGLESQILGDLQIITQVKKAYQISCEHEVAGMFLHRILHAIFYTNKQVVQSTSFRDGTASVSYAAFSIANKLSKTFISPKIAIIGAGEMGRDTALHLAKQNFKEVTILNRTIEKAKKVANECDFNFDNLTKLDFYLKNYDIIISTVEAPSPIVTKLKAKKLGICLKYFIDLSMPVSIEPIIEELPGIILYSIDDLQPSINKVVEKRKASVPKIEKMISDSIQELYEWSESVHVSPIINQLKTTLDQIRKEELARYSKKLNHSNKSLVDEITQNMIQKIIKFPVMELKSACKRGEEEKLSETIQNIFNLEKNKIESI